MTGSIIRLHPAPREELPLQGLYLRDCLYHLGTADAPFVYANFVSSLDGRIALRRPDAAYSVLPQQITSANDLRLLFELQAQADCIVTHGGYLRALTSKRLGNVLQVGIDSRWPDIVAWRRESGLREQPAIVIASASLDFPIPDEIKRFGQRIVIATGAASDPDRVASWRTRGYEVIHAGAQSSVEAAPLVGTLAREGYRSIYLLAGPAMVSTMVRDRCLSRLYLTVTHRLLGGDSYHTITRGPELGVHGSLLMRELYYDPAEPDGTSQWFAQFEPRVSSE